MRNSSAGGGDPYLSTSVAGAVVLSTIMFFSLVLNVAVCVAIIQCSKLRLVSSVFIFNLCLADIFITMFSMSLWLWFHIEGREFARKLKGYGIVFSLWVMVDIFSGTLIILSLAAISVDKFIAITRPLRYKAAMTKRTNSVAVILIWIYAISASSIYWAKPDVHPRILTYSLLGVCFVLPLLVIVVAYARIYVIAKSHAHVLSMQAGRHKAKEIKAAKTIAVVIGTFCLCWIPFFTLVIVYTYKIRVPTELANATKWLTYLNAFLNPVIYTMLDRRFRTVLFDKLLPCVGPSSDEGKGKGQELSFEPTTSEQKRLSSSVVLQSRQGSRVRANIAEV